MTRKYDKTIVTNQLGISFNAARESSTASSHNLNLSGHILLKRNLQKQVCHTFLEFYDNQE